MIEQRQLDESEHFFIKDNGNDIFLATKFCGVLDAKALELAFSHLCRRHPMLCSRIRQENEIYALSYSTDFEPEFQVRDAEFDEILNRFGETSRFCRSEYGFENNLGRVILVQNPGAGYVILGVHHALYAGAGAFELQRQLWEIYTRVAEGENIAEPVGKLPPSPSQVLRERGIVLKAKNGGSSKTLSELKAEWKPDYCSQYIQLSEEETAQILRAAKDDKVSVSGFMIGSLVVALKNVDRKVEGDALNVSTLMDMGRYANPPVSALDTTYFATPVTIVVPTFENAIDVGLEYERSLKRKMRDVSTFRTLSADSSALSNLSSARPEVAINNGGRVCKCKTPKGIEIDNIYVPHLMTNTVPMVQMQPGPPNRRASVTFFTYHSKMTLMLSGRVEIFEDFMCEMSTQIGRYGVTISELKEYE